MNNNFSLGLPAGSYTSLLKAMSSTSVHSSQTSSIPLADFWHPNRNERLQIELFDVLGITKKQYLEASKSFEFPTNAFKNGFSGPKIRYSGPSMSDMMIESDTIKITVEAKYTEYKKDSCPYSPLIGEWIHTHESNPSLIHILNCWRRYIGLENYNSLEDAEKDHDFPYQFLHRVASACFNSDGKNKVLLYQLFYDSSTKDKLDDFENNLKSWANILGLQHTDLHFIIAEIEINEPLSPALFSHEKGNLFIKMIDAPQYRFNSMTCKDGYSLEIIK